MFMPIAPLETCSERPTNLCPVPLRGKRAMDVALILLFTPVTAALMAIIAAVLLTQGGGVFYTQTRIGQGGKLFRLWKFRTMAPDAAAMLQTHLSQNPDAAREWQASRKLHNDPRISRFGRFLRKSSMDELPQLWNVLRGEMSLVGPRPVPISELAEKYRNRADAYLQCRPGVTGLWQVSGRNRLPYAERVRLDVAYAAAQNMWLDLWILWRTIGVVVRGTGC